MTGLVLYVFFLSIGLYYTAVVYSELINLPLVDFHWLNDEQPSEL